MNAYQFTRFEADKTHLLVAKGYDIDIVKFKIESANPGKNLFRDTKEYKDAKDVYYDLTMSCTEEEALNWLGHWMLNAIAYASQTKDMNWRAYFMAAYDIHESILKNRSNRVVA